MRFFKPVYIYRVDCWLINSLAALSSGVSAVLYLGVLFSVQHLHCFLFFFPNFCDIRHVSNDKKMTGTQVTSTGTFTSIVQRKVDLIRLKHTLDNLRERYDLLEEGDH